MALEKVSFVYPTLIRPGMIAKGPYAPELLILIDPSLSDTNTLAITCGMFFKALDKYTTEVDILHNGVSAIAQTTSSGSSELIRAHETQLGQCIYIYTLFVSSVKLDKEGPYLAVVRIFNQVDGVKVGEALHENDCVFYVSHTHEQRK